MYFINCSNSSKVLLFLPGVYILTKSWPNGLGKKLAFEKEGTQIKDEKERNKKEKLVNLYKMILKKGKLSLPLFLTYRLKDR